MRAMVMDMITDILLFINLFLNMAILYRLTGVCGIRRKEKEPETKVKTFKEKQDEAFAQMMNLDISTVYGVREVGDNGER